mgnify:CR=1 FL=1
MLASLRVRLQSTRFLCAEVGWNYKTSSAINFVLFSFVYYFFPYPRTPSTIGAEA